MTTYRIDWLTPPTNPNQRPEQGTERFATQQEAEARKAEIRREKPDAIVTGPYKTAYKRGAGYE